MSDDGFLFDDSAGTPSDLWTQEHADRYDDPDSPMFAPELLERTTSFLAQRADGGAALEFAIGTGRVGIPLRERGVPVSGIEFSAPMAARLREKDDRIPVVIGDMSSARAEGAFSLVYLVFNTIGNLWTQDAQVACFRNAARHLVAGGRFVIEVGVPSVRSMPPGQSAVPFDISTDHLGFDEYDLVTQRAVSHHYSRGADGAFHHHPHHYRYVWPSELDLMARLAGLDLEERCADWTGAPFTAESTSHVSVWRKPEDGPSADG